MIPITPPPRIPRILVVDDTPANFQIVGRMLSSSLSCTLTFAMSGHQALKCIRESLPDLILLDVVMPGLDGLDVCRSLKANPETTDIPVIFLTAWPNTEKMVAGFKAGGADYISKPFNKEELLARVQSQLKIRESVRTIATQNEELRQLVHVLCHDLANPVGTILHLAESAFHNRENDSESLSLIRESAHHASDMIQLVSQIRAVDEGKYKERCIPLPLDEAVQAALSNVRERLVKKDIRFQTEIPANFEVVAEPISFVNSVLTNLFSNAIKFSHPGSEVLVRAWETGETICLEITDKGIGIPPQILSKLFHPAEKTNRPGTAGEMGTGFGMPLVKKFVDSYRGSIHVISRDIHTCLGNEHGTTISLGLLRPLPPSPPSDTPST